MRVIKRGNIPGGKIHRSKCTNCNTVVEFKEEEAEREFSIKNETYLKVVCPLCYGVIWKEI